MIITITLNPCLDHTLIIPDFQPGDTCLAENSLLVPAGKGVNVSRVLNSLGVPSVALIVIGNDTKTIFEKSFEGTQITPHIIAYEGKTRVNTTIVSPGKKETHIREEGNSLLPQVIEQVMKYLEISLHKEDTVVFSGSLPPRTPIPIWQSLLSLSVKKGAFVLVDTSKQALIGALEIPVSAITPNQEEFCFITKNIEDNPDRLARYAQEEVKKRNMKWIAITLAEKGAILAGKDFIFKSMAYPVDFISSVGSGDAFLAGMIAGIYQNMPLERTLSLATACGSASCEQSSAGCISLERVKYFFAT